MTNNILNYLSIVRNVIDGYEAHVERRIEEADNGQDSTVDQGKSKAIDEVDIMVEDLHELRMNIKRMSYKQLKEKYKS